MAVKVYEPASLDSVHLFPNGRNPVQLRFRHDDGEHVEVRLTPDSADVLARLLPSIVENLP